MTKDFVMTEHKPWHGITNGEEGVKKYLKTV